MMIFKGKKFNTFLKSKILYNTKHTVNIFTDENKLMEKNIGFLRKTK